MIAEPTSLGTLGRVALMVAVAVAGERIRDEETKPKIVCVEVVAAADRCTHGVSYSRARAHEQWVTKRTMYMVRCRSIGTPRIFLG